jgi:hypothetical protein
VLLGEHRDPVGAGRGQRRGVALALQAAHEQRQRKQREQRGEQHAALDQVGRGVDCGRVQPEERGPEKSRQARHPQRNKRRKQRKRAPGVQPEAHHAVHLDAAREDLRESDGEIRGAPQLEREGRGGVVGEKTAAEERAVVEYERVLQERRIKRGHQAGQREQREARGEARIGVARRLH